MPRSVICSPSHIRNIVPAVMVIVAGRIHWSNPGVSTMLLVCSADAAASDWKKPSTTVP
jgi:hypothetical protein